MKYLLYATRTFCMASCITCSIILIISCFWSVLLTNADIMLLNKKIKSKYICWIFYLHFLEDFLASWEKSHRLCCFSSFIPQNVNKDSWINAQRKSEVTQNHSNVRRTDGKSARGSHSQKQKEKESTRSSHLVTACAFDNISTFALSAAARRVIHTLRRGGADAEMKWKSY